MNIPTVKVRLPKQGGQVHIAAKTVGNELDLTRTLCGLDSTRPIFASWSWHRQPTCPACLEANRQGAVWNGKQEC